MLTILLNFTYSYIFTFDFLQRIQKKKIANATQVATSQNIIITEVHFLAYYLNSLSDLAQRYMTPNHQH